MMPNPFRRTFALVDLEAVEQNVRAVRSELPDNVQLCCVVKADAYGHGSVPVSLAAERAGASMLAVAMAEEALPLRKAGVRLPILVLGPSNPGQMQLGIDLGLDLCVFTPEQLERLDILARAQNSLVRVHLKVDTGMGRVGLRSDEEMGAVLAAFDSCTNVALEGMFTHFANADDPACCDQTLQQADVFDDFVRQVSEKGYAPLAHISNSAGLLSWPEQDHAMVRLGIALYGYPPDDDPARSIDFRHPMEVRAEISFVKTVPAGTPIGYGSTAVTARETTIATVQIGYGDGYPRALSNRGSMLVDTVNGPVEAPIIGRVCMDMTMIDITGTRGIRPGDTAVVLGQLGDFSIGADRIADLCGTISYEILCGFTARVPRIYSPPGTVARKGNAVYSYT